MRPRYRQGLVICSMGPRRYGRQDTLSGMLLVRMRCSQLALKTCLITPSAPTIQWLRKADVAVDLTACAQFNKGSFLRGGLHNVSNTGTTKGAKGSAICSATGRAYIEASLINYWSISSWLTTPWKSWHTCGGMLSPTPPIFSPFFLHRSIALTSNLKRA